MAKLLGRSEADGADNILRNSTTGVPLKYLNNFCRSLEIFMINCKIELKYCNVMYCLLAINGNDNTDFDPNYVIIIIKDTKLLVCNVTLSAKVSQILSKLLSKGFKRSLYWNEYKTKSVYVK